MTAIQTYEVLSSWIESSKTPEHLECVANYVDNVFREMYPPIANPLHQEMISHLHFKIKEHDTRTTGETPTGIPKKDGHNISL